MTDLHQIAADYNYPIKFIGPNEGQTFSDFDAINAATEQIRKSIYKPTSMILVVRPLKYKCWKLMDRLNRKSKTHFRK